MEDLHARRRVLDRWTRDEFRRRLRSTHLDGVRNSLRHNGDARLLVTDSQGPRDGSDYRGDDNLLERDDEP